MSTAHGSRLTAHGSRLTAHFVRIVLLWLLLISAALAERVYFAPAGYYEQGQHWVRGDRDTPEDVCTAFADVWGWNRPPYTASVIQVNPGRWHCQRYKNGELDRANYAVIFGRCTAQNRPPVPSGSDWVLPQYDELHAPPCYCPEPKRFDAAIQHCTATPREPVSLTLQGPSDLWPSGTLQQIPRGEAIGATSTGTITALVTGPEGPKQGVPVSFSLSFVEGSGGHDDSGHRGGRPKGTLSATQVTTDAAGRASVGYEASEVAGQYLVTARCAQCVDRTIKIWVLVPNLLPVSPDPPKDAHGQFVYQVTSKDSWHQGEGRYLKHQYWLTETSLRNLLSLIKAFNERDWGIVALNDASLYWGGLYDIFSNWSAPHAEHRVGRNIDISFARANNPISTEKADDFYDHFCKKLKVAIPFTLLHHYLPPTRHFHVYLEGQKPCSRKE